MECLRKTIYFWFKWHASSGELPVFPAENVPSRVVHCSWGSLRHAVARRIFTIRYAHSLLARGGKNHLAASSGDGAHRFSHTIARHSYS